MQDWVERVLVITDIHGEVDKMDELLSLVQTEVDGVVFLGDAIDRGPDSAYVLDELLMLKDSYGENFHFIAGNHEKMLVDAITDGEPALFLMNGGHQTVGSFFRTYCSFQEGSVDTTEEGYLQFIDNLFGQGNGRLEFWHENLSEYADLIQSSKPYLEWGKVLFTHAGFDSSLDNWKDTKTNDFSWIRGHWNFPNTTGLINVFGHTPTEHMGCEDGEVFYKDGYIGLDGGAIFGGRLNAIVINKNGEVEEEVYV